MLDAFASKSESYPTVRLVLLSGDWINTSLPGRLRKIMTNAQMISLGGATEGGIWSIYHEIDEIVFDDELIEYRPYVYIMLNKPAGYISATKDNLHPTVLELIEGYENYDLFPVGPLWILDTEGLLLITNDGDFSHKLLAPSRNHSKIYFANIAGVMDEQDIQAFKDGIILNTGYHCKPANLEIIIKTMIVVMLELKYLKESFIK